MSKIKYLCLNLVLCLISTPIFASVDCSMRSGYVYSEYTVPLLKSTITVGRDLPVGSLIYYQTTAGTPMYVDCIGDGNVYFHEKLVKTPLPLADWPRNPHMNKLYETGVPGVGAAFVRAWTYPYTDTRYVNPSSGFNLGSLRTHRLELIKTGDVSPGVIFAENLPSTGFEVEDSTKVINVSRVHLAGQITVVSQTCETPDVFVDLGSHSIEPLVAGTETEIGRKSFSIEMRNCPIFHGYLASSNYSPINGVQQYSEKNNDIKIGFNPINGTLDNNRLIAKLDPVQPGNAPVAQGIGIALYGPSGARYTFNGSYVNVATPAIGSSADITIPLQAAYTFDTAKPKSDIKPGYGNAAIEFTIQYN